MALILGLLIICLGLYFLSLFFQVARMERTMTEAVTLLERYMILKYSLGEEKKKKEGDSAVEAPKVGEKLNIPAMPIPPKPAP
jgi:hypothetical protein